MHNDNDTTGIAPENPDLSCWLCVYVAAGGRRMRASGRWELLLTDVFMWTLVLENSLNQRPQDDTSPISRVDARRPNYVHNAVFLSLFITQHYSQT